MSENEATLEWGIVVSLALQHLLMPQFMLLLQQQLLLVSLCILSHARRLRFFPCLHSPDSVTSSIFIAKDVPLQLHKPQRQLQQHQRRQLHNHLLLRKQQPVQQEPCQREQHQQQQQQKLGFQDYKKLKSREQPYVTHGTAHECQSFRSAAPEFFIRSSRFSSSSAGGDGSTSYHFSSSNDRGNSEQISCSETPTNCSNGMSGHDSTSGIGATTCNDESSCKRSHKYAGSRSVEGNNSKVAFMFWGEGNGSSRPSDKHCGRGNDDQLYDERFRPLKRQGPVLRFHWRPSWQQSKPLQQCRLSQQRQCQLRRHQQQQKLQPAQRIVAAATSTYFVHQFCYRTIHLQPQLLQKHSSRSELSNAAKGYGNAFASTAAAGTFNFLSRPCSMRTTPYRSMLSADFTNCSSYMKLGKGSSCRVISRCTARSVLRPQQTCSSAYVAGRYESKYGSSGKAASAAAASAAKAIEQAFLNLVHIARQLVSVPLSDSSGPGVAAANSAAASAASIALWQRLRDLAIELQDMTRAAFGVPRQQERQQQSSNERKKDQQNHFVAGQMSECSAAVAEEEAEGRMSSGSGRASAAEQKMLLNEKLRRKRRRGRRISAVSANSTNMDGTTSSISRKGDGEQEGTILWFDTERMRLAIDRQQLLRERGEQTKGDWMLRFLGTGAMRSSLSRNTSAILFTKGDGVSWLFDCGGGPSAVALPPPNSSPFHSHLSHFSRLVRAAAKVVPTATAGAASCSSGALENATRHGTLSTASPLPSLERPAAAAVPVSALVAEAALGAFDKDRGSSLLYLDAADNNNADTSATMHTSPTLLPNNQVQQQQEEAAAAAAIAVAAAALRGTASSDKEDVTLRTPSRKKRISRITCVFISHLHGDHVMGLPSLLTQMAPALDVCENGRTTEKQQPLLQQSRHLQQQSQAEPLCQLQLYQQHWEAPRLSHVNVGSNWGGSVVELQGGTDTEGDRSGKNSAASRDIVSVLPVESEKTDCMKAAGSSYVEPHQQQQKLLNSDHTVRQADSKGSSFVVVDSPDAEEAVALGGLAAAQKEYLTPIVEVYGPQGLRSLLRAIFQGTHVRRCAPYRVNEFVAVPCLHHNFADCQCCSHSTIPQLPRAPFEVDGGRNIVHRNDGAYEAHEDSEAKVLAVPIRHIIPTVGYVIEETGRIKKTLNASCIDPLVRRNYEALAAWPSLQGQPKAIFKTLSKMQPGGSFIFPDGTVLKYDDAFEQVEPHFRKFCICMDTCDASSMENFVKNCDLMIHESTLCEVSTSFRRVLHDADGDLDTSKFLVSSDIARENRDSDSVSCTDTSGKKLRNKKRWTKTEAEAFPRGHSTAAMAGEFAGRVGAQRLVLTHFSQRYKGDTGLDSTLLMKAVEEEALEGVRQAERASYQTMKRTVKERVKVRLPTAHTNQSSGPPRVLAAFDGMRIYIPHRRQPRQ